MKRGEVYFVQLSPAVGSELRDLHPCVVVQSDLLEHTLRPRTVVVPITSRPPKRALPFIVELLPPEGGLTRPSYALCDQVTRIDKARVVRLSGALSDGLLNSLDAALRLVLDL